MKRIGLIAALLLALLAVMGAKGALVPVLPALTLDWRQPVWAVFYKQGALAPRVSALVDYLAGRLAGSVLDA